MKTTFFIVLMAIFLLVCKKSQAADYRHYFPLQTENNWHYRIEETETIYTLPDSIFGMIHIDGRTYYKWGDSEVYPLYIRQDKSGRIYRRIQNSDKLWFDFTKNHGEHYTWSPDGEQLEFVVTVRKNVSVFTYAGSFDNCIEFYFDNPETIDDEFSYVFAPDVGIVRKQFSRKNMLLVKAQVDRQFITRVKQTKPKVVSGYSLSQNYPNPFNPTTFIRFALPSATFVTLDIFDIRGAKVRTLVAASQMPGDYITMWDGTDDAGQLVNSGIYTYRLATDDFTDVKRMVLLR